MPTQPSVPSALGVPPVGAVFRAASLPAAGTLGVPLVSTEQQETNHEDTVDEGTMIDRPSLPGYLTVAEAVASFARAGSPMGALQLSVRAARTLGVDEGDEGAMSRVTAAASASLYMEGLLTAGLLRTASFGLLHDHRDRRACRPSCWR